MAGHRRLILSWSVKRDSEEKRNPQLKRKKERKQKEKKKGSWRTWYTDGTGARSERDIILELIKNRFDCENQRRPSSYQIRWHTYQLTYFKWLAYCMHILLKEQDLMSTWSWTYVNPTFPMHFASHACFFIATNNISGSGKHEHDDQNSIFISINWCYLLEGKQIFFFSSFLVEIKLIS